MIEFEDDGQWRSGTFDDGPAWPSPVWRVELTSGQEWLPCWAAPVWRRLAPKLTDDEFQGHVRRIEALERENRQLKVALAAAVKDLMGSTKTLPDDASR